MSSRNGLIRKDRRRAEYQELSEEDLRLREQIALEVLHELVEEWADKLTDSGKSISQLLRELANQLEGK